METKFTPPNSLSCYVSSGAAPNVQDLVEAVPEADRWRFKSDGMVKKSKPVKSGPERINTGLFNTLDNSIMKDILYFLNVKERHTVGECTDVCILFSAYLYINCLLIH